MFEHKLIFIPRFECNVQYLSQIYYLLIALPTFVVSVIQLAWSTCNLQDKITPSQHHCLASPAPSTTPCAPSHLPYIISCYVHSHLIVACNCVTYASRQTHERLFLRRLPARLSECHTSYACLLQQGTHLFLGNTNVTVAFTCALFNQRFICFLLLVQYMMSVRHFNLELCSSCILNKFSRSVWCIDKLMF